MIKYHINRITRCSPYSNIYKKIKSFFTKVEEVEEVEEYCCQECPSIEQYNWMDENIYNKLIAEGKLTQEND